MIRGCLGLDIKVWSPNEVTRLWRQTQSWVASLLLFCPCKYEVINVSCLIRLKPTPHVTFTTCMCGSTGRINCYLNVNLNIYIKTNYRFRGAHQVLNTDVNKPIKCKHISPGWQSLGSRSFRRRCHQRGPVGPPVCAGQAQSRGSPEGPWTAPYWWSPNSLGRTANEHTKRMQKWVS